MAVHCRGKSVPSQWVPFSCIEACRNQNQLRVELVGNGQDDGLEGHQVLSVAHLSPVEWNVHIKALARALPHPFEAKSISFCAGYRLEGNRSPQTAGP